VRAGEHRRRLRGFTTIERLVVVAIIGIMAAMAYPRLKFNRYRADAAGRLARTLLQSAQRDAITRQSDVIVSFDYTYQRFRIVEDYNNNDTLNTTDRVVYRKMGEGALFSAPAFGGIGGSVPSAAATGSGLKTVSSMPSIIFRRDGSASTDLELYVTTRTAASDEYRAVTVSASTGRTEFYAYTGTAWRRVSQ